MALSAGTKPSAYTSTLTGLSKSIYDQWLADTVIKSSSQITESIGDTTFTESTTARNSRVLKDKVRAWSTAKAFIDNLTVDAEIKTPVAGFVFETYTTGVGVNLVGTVPSALTSTTYPVTGTINAPNNTTIARIV